MEMKILRSKNRTSLANNLCPDHRDKQAGKPCLACEIETLSRRLERTSEACDVFEKNSANAAELFESNLKLNREITSLRTELAAMRERVEWQPIETAPRDGTAVDIWCVHPDGKTPSFRAVGVFWSGDLCKWIGIGGHWKITHWLPLPPIPTDTSKETGE